MKESREKMEKVKTETRMKMMKVNLGLTAEQSARLEKHHSTMQEKMKALREDKNLNDEQKKKRQKNCIKNNRKNLRLSLQKSSYRK
ncbi:MAG: hypothetical protein IPM85_12700 [Chitinophagaceae bacterium]|nr:hypothetical protein [Chitinophagaceae bacterium]